MGTCRWTRCRILNFNVLLSARRRLRPFILNLYIADQSALVANLGPFCCGRKGNLPSAYYDLVEFDKDDIGPLVKSVAQSKSHLFCLRESGEITPDELAFLRGRDWELLQDPARDLLVASRINGVDASGLQHQTSRQANGSPDVHDRGGHLR